MAVTFVINWVDPVAGGVSVTFNNDGNPIWVQVDKTNPDSWPQTISNYWFSEHPVIDPIPLNQIYYAAPPP